MIPTTQTPPVFITAPPAWERGVELEQLHDTGVFTSRNGLEQRQQRRMRAAFKLEYVTIYDAAALAERNTAAALEMASALIVPFWTERCFTLTAIVANAVTIDRTPDADWFLPGDFVYFDSPAGQEFREIASVNGDELTLLWSGIAFGAGARIYPCRRCLRDGQRAEWLAPSDGNASETMKFSTL